MPPANRQSCFSACRVQLLGSNRSCSRRSRLLRSASRKWFPTSWKVVLSTLGSVLHKPQLVDLGALWAVQSPASRLW